LEFTVTTSSVPDYLSIDDVRRALEIRDLTDPAQGAHAIQILLNDVIRALAALWLIPADVLRISPLVAITDNYDLLGYEPASVTRERRYSRYVSPTVMLRSHTSSGIPAHLRSLRLEPHYDRLCVLPGVVYRRDAVDRVHLGEPHQVDLWRIRSTDDLGDQDLMEMVEAVVSSVVPGMAWRTTRTSHPYTVGGRQVEVRVGSAWLELAECGLVAPTVVAAAGLDPAQWCGLALGMGLDRALMLRKGIDDIRMIRSNDDRAVRQLGDLLPWRPVSMLPPIRRDLSVVVDEGMDSETLGDRVRTALPDRVDDVESVELLSLTSWADLAPAARNRLQIRPHQANALIRLVLRPISRTMTAAEANRIRDRAYRALHEGPVLELINKPHYRDPTCEVTRNRPAASPDA
jgi:phenylalanyl-tRNA synthetase alpha chain